MSEFDLVQKSESLLKDPAFRAAIDGVREALVQRLEECPIADTVMQHEIAISLQLLKQIERHIKSFVATGELERAKKKEELSWIKRAKAQFGAY